MSKKLTYEFVKRSFDKEGYTLLSTEYKNSKTKLDYICPKGHRHNIIWNAWAKGKRCSICAGNAKLTIDFVRESFEKEDYVLLTTKYTNAKTKLKCVCPAGHTYYVCWSMWSAGRRCKVCSYIVRVKRQRKSFILIEKSFLDEGYTLLSKFVDYINACDSKLKYICPNGHTCYISWSDWFDGNRCPVCKSINFSGANNPNWRGGVSFEKYCAVWQDQEYKKDIRERDGNRCLNPYYNSKYPNDLTIHHIDYDKQNCHPSNLITVCRSCNSRANYDRKWHKAWYQAIMYRRA